MIGILLAWYLGLQYRHRPESYFRDTYHYWTTALDYRELPVHGGLRQGV